MGGISQPTTLEPGRSSRQYRSFRYLKEKRGFKSFVHTIFQFTVFTVVKPDPACLQLFSDSSGESGTWGCCSLGLHCHWPVLQTGNRYCQLERSCVRGGGRGAGHSSVLWPSAVSIPTDLPAGDNGQLKPLTELREYHHN